MGQTNFTGFSTHRKTTSPGDDLTGREPHKEDEFTGSQFLREEKTFSERKKSQDCAQLR